MEFNGYAMQLFGIMRTVDELKLFGDPTRLSRTELKLVMEVLAERSKGRDIISSELAKRLGITRSAISQIVTKLEEKDILVRADAPDDRKIAYIRLSDRAIEAFERQCREIDELFTACSEKFGKDRMQRLAVDSADFIALLKEKREASEEQLEQNENKIID